jgi:homogentisate 1,2-dioxygenase
MAFMFETRTPIHPTPWALAAPTLQQDYWRCWQDLARRFDPGRA